MCIRWKKEYAEHKDVNGMLEMNVSEWMSHVTLDIIGLAGFGHEFLTVKHEGSTDHVNKLSWAYQHLFDPSGSGLPNSHSRLSIFTYTTQSCFPKGIEHVA